MTTVNKDADQYCDSCLTEAYDHVGEDVGAQVHFLESAGLDLSEDGHQ